MTIRFGLATTTEWRKSTRTHMHTFRQSLLYSIFKVLHCQLNHCSLNEVYFQYLLTTCVFGLYMLFSVASQSFQLSFWSWFNSLSLQVLLCSPLLATYAYRFLITQVCFQKVELVQFLAAYPQSLHLSLNQKIRNTIYSLCTQHSRNSVYVHPWTIYIFSISTLLPTSLCFLFPSLITTERKRNGKELIAKRLHYPYILGFIFVCLFFIMFLLTIFYPAVT